jgi:hypothetical protein
MSVDLEDFAIGGEAKVTMNGTDWCVSNVSINAEVTEQDINNTCDFDNVIRKTWLRSIPTGLRYSGEFTVDLNKNRDPIGSGVGNIMPGKEYAGTIQIYGGKTLTGVWLIGNMTLTNNSVTGVWGVTVPFKSQGAVTVS